MKVFIKIFIVCIAVTVFYGCGSNESEPKGQPEGKEAPKSEEGHEEGPVTVAALSAAQIKAVGIVFGGIEEKELTATIKANGLLSVPNNNKANATALYGGVVKTLNVQLGDNVRKAGDRYDHQPPVCTVAGRICIPCSKITLAEQEMARQQELNEGNAGARKTCRQQQQTSTVYGPERPPCNNRSN
jgi:hypothetical protein